MIETFEHKGDKNYHLSRCLKNDCVSIMNILMFCFDVFFLLQTSPVGQKRSYSHLLPPPEASPEGAYVGQHSQGIGGHYADSYGKRKRYDTSITAKGSSYY